MKIERGREVAVRFVVHDRDGAIVDEAHAREPLVYRQGARAFLAAVELALEGRQAGDTFDVEVTMEDAYGAHNNQMIQKIARASLPEGLRVGMVVQLEVPGMEGLAPPLIFHVHKLDETFAHLDGNHPLAGKDLRFVGEVVAVR